MDSTLPNVIVTSTHTSENITSIGKFQTYPVGVFNPAFCGMLLWEIAPNHILNDYKICPFHQIKSGIILYGNIAYVFTPITNNDINSFLKILLRGKNLKPNYPPSKAVKQLVHYVWEKATNHIIPSISIIQQNLHYMLGISEKTFLDNENTYMTLLHRIYLLTFMIRYNMPLQRRFQPGNRNLSSSIYSFKGKGWYSYLTRKEQKLLNNPDITLAHEPIPDDMLRGVCRSDIDNLSDSSYSDIQNTSIFRDGSVNSMEFQNRIQRYQQSHSPAQKTPLHHHRTPVLPLISNGNEELCEVPTIEFLQNCVETCMNRLDVPFHDLITIKSWNHKFHEILVLENLEDEFPLSALPKCYGPGKSCGHVL